MRPGALHEWMLDSLVASAKGQPLDTQRHPSGKFKHHGQMNMSPVPKPSTSQRQWALDKT